MGKPHVLRVDGELDISAYPKFVEQLASVPTEFHCIVVDLSNVTSIDSISLGALLLAKFRWGREDRVMATIVTNANVLRVIDIIGAREKLNVVATHPEALKHFDDESSSEAASGL